MKNEITKAKLKNEKLEVEFKERFEEDNYSNEVAKVCSQIVHSDLKKAFEMLKPHLVLLCEQAGQELLTREVIEKYKQDDETEDILKNYIVTGYSHGGQDESAGVTIVGQKLLKSGRVLNLVSPFISFAGSEGVEEYNFADLLEVAVQGCDWEVEEYVFNDKFGLKQASLDFDTPAEKPKKEKKAKKKKNDESFDSVQVDEDGITEVEFEPIPENEVVHEFVAPDILAEAN